MKAKDFKRLRELEKKGELTPEEKEEYVTL